ncbi:TonB-dependent receptor [uncultured Dialister sp.]|jgi:iron complex outermembrane receptor protein|uniref:TonB-dependent receptor n=1 Tax=uncultured Dialister sp. TaxID=278064 RepID=UPI0025E874B4|nr:TonB-dependent receptor [uncultured Dialister sp.]
MMSFKSKEIAALLAVLALAGTGTVHAETPVYTLKGITVTANRQAERLQDVPANVQVVTEKDIQKRNVQNTAQAISMVTGVSASQSVEGTVNLRGYSSKNILVLVDGQAMNTAWNGDVDWNMIPVENIRKIEVVSGGQSALYGGRAVGGVINIMTKTQKQEGLHGSATVSYGSNATVNQNYNLGFKKNKFDFGAFYGSMNTHGWHDYDVSINNSGKANGYDSDAEGNAVIGNRGDKKVLNETFGFNLGYSFNDSQKLTYKYTHSIYDWKYEDPISYIEGANRWKGTIGENNKSYSPSSFLGTRGWRAYNLHSLTYNDKDNGVHAHFGMTDYYKDGYTSLSSKVDPKNDFSGSGTKTSYPSKSWDMDLNKRWNLGDHNLLAGVSYGQDKFNEAISAINNWKSWSSDGTVTQRTGGKDKYWSLYAQDKWNFAPKWTAYIGGRYDHYRKYDGYDTKNYTGKVDLSSGKSYEKFSPKLSLDYAANKDTNFYLSYGKSFNTPILYQLFRYSTFMGRNIYPNKDLEPETTDTWELGMKQKIGGKTDIAADVFYAKTKDYIHLNDSDKAHEFYENAGDAKTHGFEISLTQHHSDAWSSYINYTWQTGKIEGEKNYDIPRHLLHLGTTYSKNPWTVNLDGMFISDRTEAGEESGHFKARDAYFLMNLSTNYQFNKNFGLQFAVNNLFDREYYDEDISNNHYYIGDGRTYTLTARYSF